MTGPAAGQQDLAGEGGDVARAPLPEPGHPETIVVSACLLGVACNHRGLANPSAALAALGARDDVRLVSVCPETMGGLPTPRPAAERQPDGTIRTVTGIDVSDAYRRGAGAAVEVARATAAVRAILKARSPSCGCDGVTTAALQAAGLDVVSEEDVEAGRYPERPPGA